MIGEWFSLKFVLLTRDHAEMQLQCAELLLHTTQSPPRKTTMTASKSNLS
jgi:hypothetical protein